MQRFSLVVLTILAVTGSARAGICIDDQEFVDAVKVLEVVAKDPKSTAQGDTYCLSGVPERIPKYVPRVLAACTKILTRDPKHALCVEMAVRLGKKELAGVDLYAAVSSWKIDVWSWDRGDLTMLLLGKLGDGRAAPIIMDVWKANIEEAQKREKKHWGSSMMAWAGWRKDAAEALGAVGGADAKAFLDEQGKATKDKYVRQACLDAIAAIDKRLAKPAP